MKLLNEFGHMGYAAWFILLEMCAEKMQKNHDEMYSEVHCKFTFSERIVRQKLRISRTKVQNILNKCSEYSLLSYDFVGEEFNFYIPKLLESLDRDQRRARQVRDTAATEVRLEVKKKEGKNIRRKNTCKLHASARTDDDLGSRIFKSYREAYFERYKVEPKRNAKVNKQCKDLGARLGEDALEVAKFFLKHNDGFYIRTQHPVGSLLRDAEGLYTQWQRGQSVTGHQVRAFEKQSGNMELLEKVRKGEV